jgi:dienelactone hydrolase
LNATLVMPEWPRGFVIVANGADDHLFIAGNADAARALQEHGFATLEVNLLTRREAIEDAETSALRFDMDFLAERFRDVARWVARHDYCADLEVGVFAAGVCAAAAVLAAARDPEYIDAVVCRASRPDLARDAFSSLTAETLLVVGERDTAHLASHRAALESAPAGAVDVAVIAGARPRLDSLSERAAVADVSAAWFARTLNGERWRSWVSDSGKLAELVNP